MGEEGLFCFFGFSPGTILKAGAWNVNDCRRPMENNYLKRNLYRWNEYERSGQEQKRRGIVKEKPKKEP